MRTLTTLAALALLAAVACDSPTDSRPTESEVTFEYRFEGAGSWNTFAQQGSQPEGTPFETRGEFVWTGGDDERSFIFVAAQQRVAGENWSDFWTNIPVGEPGEVIELRPGELPACGGRRCTYAALVLNATGTPREICSIVSGEMVLQRADVKGVSAAFSGTGTCTGGPAARAFEIRNGQVDAVFPRGT